MVEVTFRNDRDPANCLKIFESILVYIPHSKILSFW